MNSGSTSMDGNTAIFQLRRIGSGATLSEIPDTFRLNEDVTVIGRAKGKVNFFLDSQRNQCLISRIHARIFKSKTLSGNYVFKILDTSLNGSYVNNIKIMSESPLVPGDTVAFGHLQGAALQAGKSYPQPHSEFYFKFEKICEANTTGENSTSLMKDDARIVQNGASPSSPDHSFQTPVSSLPSSTLPFMSPSDQIISLETPITNNNDNINAELCPTKRELGKIFCKNDESDNYEIFQEYAAAARLAAEMQGDSDDDLFSEKYATLLPGMVTLAHDNDQSTPEQPKKSKRSQKRTWKLRETQKSSKSSKGGCHAVKCLQPKDKLISWVQCDDCDKWYHVKCAGVSLEVVRPKDAKFQCGCSR